MIDHDYIRFVFHLSYFLIFSKYFKGHLKYSFSYGDIEVKMYILNYSLYIFANLFVLMPWFVCFISPVGQDKIKILSLFFYIHIFIVSSLKDQTWLYWCQTFYFCFQFVFIIKFFFVLNSFWTDLLNRMVTTNRKVNW